MSNDHDIKMAEIGGHPVAETGSQEQGDIYERHLSSAEKEKYGRIKRGLTPRHVQVMAIGGSIGTGLFVGIGGSLSRVGPLSLLLGYLCKYRSLLSSGLYDKKTLEGSC
jgi:amino acid transporter